MRAPTDLFVRFFADMPGASDDVDFYVYRQNSANESDLSLLTYGNNIGTQESVLFRLNQSSYDYWVEVYFFFLGADTSRRTCATYSLEIAARPVDVVRNELRCPVTLPNEARQVPSRSVYTYSDTDVSSDEYLFTSDRIRAHTNLSTSDFFSSARRFEYAIDIHNTYRSANASVSASIAFDFLANDYRLELRGPAGAVIGRSTSMPDFRDAASFNFGASIGEIALPTHDVYSLVIVEELADKLDFGVMPFCSRFGFDLHVSTDRLPRVLSVHPASARDLNPLEDLVITVSFSAPVYGYQIIDAARIRSADVAHLTPSDAGAADIYPVLAYVSASEQTALVMRFPNASLSLEKTYTLHLNASAVASGPNGQTFAPWSSLRHYTMKSCEFASLFVVASSFDDFM